MRVLVTIGLSFLLAGGAMAQRGGGGHGGGGGMGGGSHGGMGGGGGFGGGHGGMGGGGFTGGGHRGGGFGGGGFGFGGGFGRTVFGHPSGGLRGVNGFGFSIGYPYYGYGYLGYGGLGYGGYYGGYYWPGYMYPYYDSYMGDGGYAGGGGYASYSQQPNVTVIYPPQQPGAVYLDNAPAHPVTHEYDQYGQEIRRDGTAAPLYLLAFKDKTIRAATAYWVDGRTLHYVTYEHEQKQAPLDTVDRDLTMRLNGERHVEIQLPQ